MEGLKTCNEQIIGKIKAMKLKSNGTFGQKKRRDSNSHTREVPVVADGVPPKHGTESNKELGNIPLGPALATSEMVSASGDLVATA